MHALSSGTKANDRNVPKAEVIQHITKARCWPFSEVRVSETNGGYREIIWLRGMIFSKFKVPHQPWQ